MIRWYVDKEGNKRLQRIAIPYGGEKITFEKILSGKFVFPKWEDIPIVHEDPVEMNKNAKKYFEQSMKNLDRLLEEDNS